MVFLGLIGLVIVLGVPYLLVSHTRLKARVLALESNLKNLQGPAEDTAVEDETGRPPYRQIAKAARQATSTIRKADITGDVSPAPPPDSGADTGADIGADIGADTEPDTGPTAAPAGAPRIAPRAFVFRRDSVDRLIQWARENWVLVAGAASLALAGIFMVQYGAERGFLTPFWRVMATLGFGSALIGGGEVIRRRFGDETTGSMQYLPSALAGAGLIVLFAGVLSARVMYDLIGPGAALAGLSFVSAVAMILGWFYGPLLSAVGIIGASGAPFLVGGSAQDPWILYYYFTLIAVAGLAVDAVKRWAWMSVLVLIATLSASGLLYLSGAAAQHFLVAVLLIAAAAIIIPERSLIPRHGGTAVLDLLRAKRGKTLFPEFPTRLSVAVTGVVTGAALLVVSDAATSDTVYLGLFTLVLLLIATLVWMRQAPALYDHALLPGLAILTVLLIEADFNGPLYSAFRAGALRAPETAAPITAWVLTAIGALGSVLAFYRMKLSLPAGDEQDNTPVFWALAAAVYAPVLVLLLEFFWDPGSVVGAYPWALATIAVAGLMTVLAERTARGENVAQRRLRVGLFAVAALTLIALAFFLLLSETALTLALAVMTLLVVVLDRRYDLSALSWFVQLGVAVITYRLVVDPGFIWATGFSFSLSLQPQILQVVLAYGGTLLLLAGAWRLARDNRTKTALILESGIWTIAAVFICVLIFRAVPEANLGSHWSVGLLATVWAASLANQLYRMQASNRFTLLLRGALATLFTLMVLALLAVLFLFSNPLINRSELVVGPLILDTLAVAYLPLAVVFAVAAWKLAHFTRWLRIFFAGLASALTAWYVTQEIRRLWRGNDLSVPGVTDPELYSYTLAMLITSVVILFLAFSRRALVLRKLAMAGVALTIAKVFLIDMNGLSGLTRVFSFMGLGLTLVALAWLNRVMTEQWNRGGPGSAAPVDSEV
ncbi:DUF2339 domain-containing protein [Candidatus Halocynthiibacter alkanivorans]|uniref:DUF2339 domain-containing protein n=1 Tax=Candidatus Halocynthiibacter alkanivorans TaxID=2267619 RepID=UPI000DF246E1|nr:DUF2339 domain-containing protein [Candidatus Halocynthiibacter alkanivorans]